MIYPISRLIIPPILKLWLRKVDGIENIPKKETFVIAANHTSYYETLLIPSIVVPEINRRVHAFCDSTYWKFFITRFFLELWEIIPVSVNKEKGAKEKNKASMKVASGYLKKGHIIMIFPEGGRSHDGRLQKAYNGVSRLALMSKVPVLPIGVIGANNVLPKGKFFPRLKRCEVKIGKPIYFDKYYGKIITKKILEEATREIMREIARLIGQKYSY